MKKMICVLLIVLLSVGILSGCGNSTSQNSDKLHIVVTIFPEYDWVMQILGEEAANADVTLLLDNGVDLHSYQPTVTDMVTISTCDLFIYVGGESDGWVTDALKNAVNQDRVVINLLTVLGDAVKEEETVEGMENGHEAEEEDGTEGEEEHEYDEHVWLSLKNAAVLVDAIKDELVKLDADRSDVYTANAASYIEKLNTLDAQYKAAVDAAEKKTVLFGDRFPFRYLVDDYGLSYYAAFSGCSAESEASFETIAFLARMVDELGLTAVLTVEGAEHRIAETIVATTTGKDIAILSMDSMQSATMADVNAGVTYLSIMEKNLNVLKEALK